PVPLGDVHLDRVRLPRRAYAVRLARPELVLRGRGPGGLPEGPLLPVPERVDRPADAAPLPALELGPRGYHRCVGLHQRRRTGAVPERRFARREAEGGRRPPPDVAGAVRAGTLRAVARRGGQVTATQEVKTAGAPARLAIAPDRA